MSEHIFFTNITHNNLKNLSFKMATNEIVVVSGVSGSGKSTLVNQVIAAEALRQNEIRRESDKIIHYSVRPAFSTCSLLPAPIIVNQRSAHVAENISFGTRTRINELLVKYFVKEGKITHRQHNIYKPSLPEIFVHQQRFYTSSHLFLRVTNFEALSANQYRDLINCNIDTLLLRAEGKSTFKETKLNKLPVSLEKYEGFIAIESLNDAKKLSELKAVPVLMLNSKLVDKNSADEYDHDEIEFDQHGFSPEDCRIFRLPSPKLFSRATQSSTAGYCRQCQGSGKQVSYNLDSVILTDIPLAKEFLNVGRTKSGRYLGFKFLPSGLSKILKKEGIDIELSFNELTITQRDIVMNILQKKLDSNIKDKFSQSLITERPCSSCRGSGFGWQSQAVKVNGMSLFDFLNMNGEKLNKSISEIKKEHPLISQINNLLYYLQALAIDHISFERPLTSLSSGELQRMKLLPALVENLSNRLFILDEPSSNLQYKDNFPIIKLLNLIKSKGNGILIVEHNPLYQIYADRVLYLGPDAGLNGGKYCQPPSMLQQVKGLSIQESKTSVVSSNTVRLNLIPVREVRLNEFTLHKNVINTVVGASGSGKSTLCREMLYPALISHEYSVELLDSSPFTGASSSIVATYLGVFDELRQFFSAQSQGQYTAHDFSFNAAGACEHCGGKGVVDIGSGEAKNTLKQTCPVCFGSRFRAEIALFHVQINETPISLPQVLNSDFTWIMAQVEFAKIHPVISTLESLSLGHLHLGRETQTLSGGELQRLKLAKFLVTHWLNAKSTSKSTTDSDKKVLILDEPCRGLDSKAVTRFIGLLREHIARSTFIVIEHNPYFIYQSDYIVDLGCSCEQKTADNIYQSELYNIKNLDLKERLEKFPSLNHEQVMELAQTNNITQHFNPEYNYLNRELSGIIDSTLSEYTKETITSAGRSQQRYQLIPKIYRQQKNFERERLFADNFNVVVPDKNVFFYRDFSALKSAVFSLNPQVYFYNPFICQLERYSKVPLSHRKSLLHDIPNRIIVNKNDDWNCLISTEGIESAYLKGAGVVIVRDKDENLSYHGVRLFSLVDKVADRVFPHQFAFNLYKNSCMHCHGYGKILSYPLKEWVNEKKCILDKDAFPFEIKKKLPKRTIDYFANREDLFDFNQPIEVLSQSEKDFLYYGFKAYRFLKGNAKSTADYQYYEWEGLNSYIYDQRKQLSSSRLFVDEVDWVDCPFCTHGFPSKIKYYKVGTETFVDEFN